MESVTVNIPMPQEKQLLFMQSKARNTAYGGARGGGKSWSVRVKAVLMCARYPGIKIFIIRRTYAELNENHIVPLKTMTAGIARYTAYDKKLTFKNGSVIKMWYCRNVADMDKFQGNEADVIFIDEATQLTEEMYDRIKVCVRGVNNYPKRMYLTCNPGGIGHGWVKRLFITRVYRAGEDPGDYAFIAAKAEDNFALMSSDPEYIKQLQALPLRLRQAWLDGNWDIFEGQFFEEFIDDERHYEDRRGTHVIAPFPIPSDWNIYRSFDWGYSKPFSCGWWAVDYDGRIYRIAEYYGCRDGAANEGVRLDPHEVFVKIKEIESTHPLLRGKQISGVADPSIWDKSRGISIVEEADRALVHFVPGDNKRIPGWMQVHRRMTFDGEGRPMMYIFNVCRDFIRTIPSLIYSERDPEDLDTDGEDHIADEMRYMCMTRPIAAQKTEREKKNDTRGRGDPLNLRHDKF